VVDPTLTTCCSRRGLRLAAQQEFEETAWRSPAAEHEVVSRKRKGRAAMQWSRVVAPAVLVAALATSAGASPSSIGAFFDAEATDCDISVAPFSVFNVYISVVLGSDAAGGGFLGATFRVYGLSGLVLSVAPNPAASATFGDPTGSSSTIVFPTCMTGVGPRNVVLLYTIACSGSYPVSSRTVTVLPETGPCDSCAPCRFAPCVALCDDPVFTQVFVLGGQALINNGPCTVGVEATAWSEVKALYR
jgi:hypothetical protein